MSCDAWADHFAPPARRARPGLFTYHPAFQSLAVLLFTEGVLVLQPTRTAGAKSTGLKLHQIFQLSALPCLLAGSFFIFYNKLIHSAAHFTSWHARFGLATVVLVFGQITLGALLVYVPGLFGGEARAKSFWKHHRWGGYTTLALFFLTPALAIGWSDWVVGHSTRLERGLMLGGLALSAVGVASRISPKKLGL